MYGLLAFLVKIEGKMLRAIANLVFGLHAALHPSKLGRHDLL